MEGFRLSIVDCLSNGKLLLLPIKQSTKRMEGLRLSIVDCLSNGKLLLLSIVQLNKKDEQYKTTQQLTMFLVL